MFKNPYSYCLTETYIIPPLYVGMSDQFSTRTVGIKPVGDSHLWSDHVSPHLRQNNDVKITGVVDVRKEIFSINEGYHCSIN